MPALECGQALTERRLPGPRLACPRILLDDRNEVHKRGAAYEIMHEMLPRPHPYLSFQWQLERCQSIRGDQTAVGHTPGELRALAPKHNTTHRRMNPIRAYQS